MVYGRARILSGAPVLRPRNWHLTVQRRRNIFVQMLERKAKPALTVNRVSDRVIQINAARFFGVPNGWT